MFSPSYLPSATVHLENTLEESKQIYPKNTSSPKTDTHLGSRDQTQTTTEGVWSGKAEGHSFQRRQLEKKEERK